MRKYILTLFAMFIFAISIAQTEKPDEIKTLFGDKTITKGGFGSLSFGIASGFVDQNTLMTGVRGGWILNHWISFGLGGYNLASGLKRDIGWTTGNPRTLSLYMGYGGLYIEPTLFPKKPIHLSFPILLGAGGATYIDETYYWDPDNNTFDFRREDADAFVVIEPGAFLELNIIKNLRLGFGAQYRYVNDLVLFETDPKGFDGITYCFSLKLGKF